MRKQLLFILIPGVVIGAILAWIVLTYSETPGTASVSAKELLAPVPTNNAQPSFGDLSVRSAQATIEKQPADPLGYNQLSAAFMQKARETGDFSFNARAEEALKHSFRIAPDNYDGLKQHAAVLLNFHRFQEALQVAERARLLNPKDYSIYDAIVDARVELGDYQGAVDAAQSRVDLRPDTSAYSRISYLRSLHGDRKGAIEMMRMAVGSANPSNPEGIAWCRVHLGDELVRDGQTAAGEREYDHALFIFPDYHLALAAKGRARYAAGDYENAILNLKRATERVPLPEYVAALGDIYAKLGREDEAKQQYAQVEVIEKLGTHAGTYSLQMAHFWADHDMRLDEALAAAERERAARNDIFTADVLAWCLYKKGRFAEAKTAINEALRLGTRDPRLLYHAGMISFSNGDNQQGVDYLKQALAINPSFDILQADVAREKLKVVKG